MSDENNKKEEQQPTEEVTVPTTVTVDDAGDKEDQPTFAQQEKERKYQEKIKNLTAALILVAGFALGSLFVDLVQFTSGSGYSEKALRNAEIFEGGGKTWIAQSDPPIIVTVLTTNDEGFAECPKCDPTEIVSWMKRFVPTAVPKRVVFDTEEGKALMEKYNVKALPAFILDGKIAETDFFEEAKVIFDEKDGSYVLNIMKLQAPVGKYVQTPGFSDADPIIGNKDAKVPIVVFSDFECPYCKNFYSMVTKIANERKDDVALVYKEFPLDEIHKQASNAAMAALCAKEQKEEDFWKMGDLLYNSQKEWSAAEGKEKFKAYGRRLGLDAAKFNECMDTEKYNGKLKEDLQLGMDFGIAGTPAAFVGTEFVGGGLQEADLIKLIDEQLQK
jgi:protein-disulfide isomerase